MAEWTGPAALDALKAILEARPALADVDVFTAPASDSPPAPPNQTITLIGIEGDQDWAAIGKKARDDEYRIPTEIFAVVFGTGEAVAKEARDAAKTLLHEVEKALRSDPTLAGVVRVAEVKDISLNQGAGDEDRWAQITFRIAVHARI